MHHRLMQLCHGCRVVEVKCPYKHRDANTLRKMQSDKAFYFDLFGKLKGDHSYYTQVQHTVVITVTLLCGLTIHHVYYNHAMK